MSYDISSNDIVEIIAGTSNTIAKEFTEAKSVYSDQVKGETAANNLVKSINKFRAGRFRGQSPISQSKGNIKSFKDYKSIQTNLKFLQSHAGSTDLVKSLTAISNTLEKNSRMYAKSYDKKVQMVINEYEAAVESLQFGIPYAFANSINVEIGRQGELLFKPDRSNKKLKFVHDTIIKFSKELTTDNHKQYLETLLNNKERRFTESLGDDSLYESFITTAHDAVVDIAGLYTMLRNSVIKVKNIAKVTIRTFFGVAPLIRSVFYIAYKTKADKILALEELAKITENNIKQLASKPNTPENRAIIKKQEAVVKGIRKKKEKLIASMNNADSSASKEIGKENSKVNKPANTPSTSNKNNDDDGELVLD